MKISPIKALAFQVLPVSQRATSRSMRGTLAVLLHQPLNQTQDREVVEAQIPRPLWPGFTAYVERKMHRDQVAAGPASIARSA